MDDVVGIVRAIFDRLLSEARANPALEICGLLAGRDGFISEIFPAKNALNSATQFEIAPEELFAIFRHMRSEGLELLGIYHSHPKGENLPSRTDIERAFYPEAAYLIATPARDARNPLRAFHIWDGNWRELRVEIIG